MDFLKALRQAEQQGVTKEQFLPIWEADIKLRQQQEEARVLELKVKLMEQNGECDSPPVGVETLIKQQFQQQKKELNQIKSDLLLYQQAMLQVVGDISSLLTSVIIPTAGDRTDNAATSAAAAPPTWVPNWGNPAPASGSANHQNIDILDLNHGKPQKVKQIGISKQQLPHSNINTNIDTSVIFTLKDIQGLLTSKKERLSPPYFVPSCPCTFKLSVDFDESQNLAVQLVVIGKETVSETPEQWPVSIYGKAYIQNKAKGFSQICEISDDTQNTLEKLKSGQKTQLNTFVCLKTSSGKFEPVTYSMLEARNFVTNNSITIRWNLNVKQTSPVASQS